MARKRGADAGKGEALDKGLKAMFRKLEKRPTPPALRRAVDELEAERKAKKTDG